MNADPNDIGTDDDDTFPASTDPLSPGRTDLDPSEDDGVDELPDNEGDTPMDDSDEAAVQENVPDQDVADAEMDGEPNPR